MTMYPMEAKSLCFKNFLIVPKQYYTIKIALKNFTCLKFLINIIANTYERDSETVIIYHFKRNKWLHVLR